MNAVLIFLTIIGGVNAFGVLGLFYGPLFLTMFLSLAEIYKQQFQPQLTKHL